MKRYILKQIVSYLQKFKKIYAIERVEDSVIKMVFDKNEVIFFDMKKGSSSIYKKDDYKRSKEYIAPFDIVLKKRLNSAFVEKVEILEGNRIIRFTTSLSSKYKKNTTLFQLEFTGRNTNAIILEEDKTVIEALRHIDKSVSFREIQTGVKLLELPPFEFREKEQKIKDIEKYLYEVYKEKELQRLQILKNQKLIYLAKKREKLQKIYNSLEDEKELLKKSDLLKEDATLVLSNLHNIKNHQKEILLKDFEDKERKITLPNRARTPQEGANMLFTLSKKLKQKAKYSHIERENLKSKIDFIDKKTDIVKNAKNSDEINILFPKQEKKKGSKKEKNDYESYFVEGYKIMVGKSEKGNIELLKSAKMSDIWLHLKDIPSTHVIIKTDKKRVDEKVLHFAAKLCVDFSVFQKGGYLVDFTQRRNVKIKERAFVNYVNYDTIKIVKE